MADAAQRWKCMCALVDIFSVASFMPQVGNIKYDDRDVTIAMQDGQGWGYT